MGRIYINDVGTEFRVDTKINLSTATDYKLKVKKPYTEDAVEWIPTADTGEDGIMSILTYNVDTGDLDVAGWYVLVSYVEFGSGANKFHGEPTRFEVNEVYLP